MPTKLDDPTLTVHDGTGDTVDDSLDGNQPQVDLSSTPAKKKKKRKPKKPSKPKEPALVQTNPAEPSDLAGRPPVLCISRNKHWRYISSYHGPWLQLPLELLESLLALNLDPATLSTSESRPPLPSPQANNTFYKSRERALQHTSDYSPPDSPHLTAPPSFPTPRPGKAIPPPIDPGVFRSVTSIRRLIDEAAELSVRATSGLSAAALGSMRGGGSPGVNGSPWAAAQSMGLNPMGDSTGGRNVAMSAMRAHRLRALAVQKLAQAYKADEIASSVMVMQGGSVFDDVAERVLKVDPHDIDARYVNFFHEKIPSRQLAESTTTQVLDELIAAQPQRLEFYRTRGIVHCFRDEYYQATKDFTFALKEARAARKAKAMHRNTAQTESRNKGARKKNSNRSNGQAPPNGTSVAENMVEGPDGEQLVLHPSVLPDAPEPIEPQLLFLRGAAYLQQAVFLIEGAILSLEGICKVPSVDGAELRLCYIENGKYGGVEIGHPDGPLGKRDGVKLLAYRKILAEQSFREHITMLLKKSMRDHEKFLTHFDTLEGPSPTFDSDFARKTEHAFLLCESVRPGNNHANPTPLPDSPVSFTTYHPLLVESHFTILICQLMLADFPTILPTFARTASLVDGLEGCPVFLPPRSMAQAEFVEVLERLASGWKNGIQPHSNSKRANSKARLQIEAPLSPPPIPTQERILSSECAASSSKSALDQGCSSSSTSAQYTAPSESESVPFGDGSSSFEDLARSLDCARILLAPVLTRQKERAEKAATEKAAGANKKKPLAINIPLHGPRVEIVLAWLGAVHLFELDAFA